jgi:hypothetical protein
MVEGYFKSAWLSSWMRSVGIAHRCILVLLASSSNEKMVKCNEPILNHASG